EPLADESALAALADWCVRYSPWSAIDGVDGIRLDITGCAHLFGGETRLLAEAEARISRFGFMMRGAIADTPAAAWAWARFRRAQEEPVLSAGEIGPLLMLPVAALNLEPETVATLERLGLGTIGAVASLPRAPLVKRLGERLMARLDQLLGRAPEPISPRLLPVPYVARMIFVEPIGTREDMDLATSRLATRLCDELARDGKGARRLTLAFYRVDGTVQRLTIGTSLTTCEPSHLLRLFAERLDGIDPSFGIEVMTLEAEMVQEVTAIQAALSGGDRMDEVDLARLIDRLRNRLGDDRVLQPMPIESHVPERAERWVPAPAPSPSRRFASGPFLSHLRGRGGQRTPLPLAGEGGTHCVSNGRMKVRPLKLLTRPEPIDATAPIPDDPPLSFRWRRVFHRVISADGPERIGPEWWKPTDYRPRDYYRIEDADGRRFWVYREGLYGGGEPPRWFLHGFFA
ncbi:MAG TPA: DNA polymerase Y family protein, partial [Alphaproteobacteria bacterium]|nr:DNA polymerase Y family protein [Alphaproteobacteria bacterium]